MGAYASYSSNLLSISLHEVTFMILHDSSDLSPLAETLSWNYRDSSATKEIGHGSETAESQRPLGTAAHKSRRTLKQAPPTEHPMPANTGTILLSLQEFSERVTLLSQLELPCIIFIANAAVEHLYSGVIRRIERTDDRLGLLGDDFALHLHKQNIDSIWLVNNPAPNGSAMAVEIYNKAGTLITRIFGIHDRVGSAVWQDVMANPSLCVA